MAGKKVWEEFKAKAVLTETPKETMKKDEKKTKGTATKEEIDGTATPASYVRPQKRNAYDELMAPKPKTSVPGSKPRKSFRGTAGLGTYTENPELHKDQIIFETDTHVAIRDAYPKSDIHTLLLFKSDRNLMHPFDAFEDAEFLASAREAATRLRTYVAQELARRYGKLSAQDKLKQQVLDGEIELEDLPAGRAWEDEVLVGVHANPSMDHLHVHVTSRDLHSRCLKTNDHYMSFTTEFFVPLRDFPLERDDHRRFDPLRILKQDLLCWRCSRNFKRSRKALQEHLEEEFAEWIKE